MHMYILYSEYLTCMYIYLCKKVQNTVCFVATYRSCYRRMFMSLSGLVQLCTYWCSDLLCESLCSEPSVQPQHRKNAILGRNRTASYRRKGSTLWGPWRAARQLHDRASVQSFCEWNDHKVTWERCVQDCYNQTLPVCVTGIPWQ
jgi:hypothetical protein